MARTRFTVKEGISVADDATPGGYPLVPVGSVIPYAGSTAPDGWLLCNGQTPNRTTYANLFAVVGTTYGAGNGTTTFGIPDPMGRTIVGVGSGAGLTARTLATQNGVESVVIASGNLPTHAHTITHGHANTISATTGGQSVDHTHTLTTGGVSANHTHAATHAHTGSSAGAGVNHDHQIPRAAIGTAGTNRLVLSASPTDNSLTTIARDAIHSHGVTVDTNTFSTGTISSDHSHSGTSAGASVGHSHTVTVAGGVTDNTTASTGNGGFANTALPLMNPFLALNFIIKY